MAVSTTSNLGLKKQDEGDNNWDDAIRDNWGILDTDIIHRDGANDFVGDQLVRDDVKLEFGTGGDFSLMYSSSQDWLQFRDETNTTNVLRFDRSQNVTVANGNLIVANDITDGTNTIYDSTNTTIGDGLVDVGAATFTDQQLSTTDSPTFSGATFSNFITINDGNNKIELGSPNNNDISELSITPGNGSSIRWLSQPDSNFALRVRNSSSSQDLFEIKDDAGRELQWDSNGNLRVNSGNVEGVGTIQLSDTDGDGDQWKIKEDTTFGGDLLISHPSRGDIVFEQNGNIFFGGSSFITIDQRGSDPATQIDRAQIYSKDVSGTAEMFVQNEAGTTTQISPHDSDGYYYVNHTVPSRGIRQEIDVEKAIKFLEEEFGKDFIREYELNKEAV